MTKAELIQRLSSVPDSAIIRVPAEADDSWRVAAPLRGEWFVEAASIAYSTLLGGQVWLCAKSWTAVKIASAHPHDTVEL
jgi:hypothetical protein